MKKQAVFSLLLIALTSCATMPKSSITINGDVYKTGFYKYYGDDLHILGLEAKDISTAEVNQGKYHYWKLEGQKYPFYYGVHEDSLTWSPALYCITSKLLEAKKYYADLDNYDYYIGTYSNEDSYIKVEDEKYFDAIEHAIKVMVTTPFSRKQNKKIDLNAFEKLTLFRVSNDNLFTSTRDQFLYSEETGFVYLSAYFDDTEDAVYYTFTKENNELLSELYKTYKQDIPPVINNPGEGKSSY